MPSIPAPFRPLWSVVHAHWLIMACFLLFGFSQARAAVPTNFVDELIAGGLQTPTDVEIAADGRLFVAEKRGRIRVIENGGLLPVPFIDLTDEVANVADRGLMGIALDPDFANNGYIYLLYVVDPIFGQPDEEAASVTFSRLTRYTAIGNLADLSSRQILIGANPADGFPSCYNTHAAGTVAFGADGSLFVSAGDGAHADFVDDGTNVAFYDADCEAMFGSPQDIGALRAQSDLSLDGKVIRIDPATGLGLPDNPHYDGDSNSFASRIWTRGFRNPFRFTVRPGSPGQGSLYIADVGLSTWEEISVATAAQALVGGKNHGWPCFEGPTSNTTYQVNPIIGPVCQALNPANLTPPLIAWHHSEPGAIGFVGSAATAVGFYQGSSYPTQYWDALFFGDFVGDWIKVAFVDANDDLVGIQDFASAVESPVDIEFEPASDSLVYVSIIDGEVRRIRYTLDNLPPQVQASATPQGGSAPLSVVFSSDGTSDPDMDPITLEWDFGDGSPLSSSANPTHLYTTVGSFTASLTATDDQLNVGIATVDVTTANEPPSVSIDFPPDLYGFADGEQVQLAATGNDLEDPANLSWAWEVRLVHNSHQHPEFFTSTQPLPPLVSLANHGAFGDRFSYIIKVTVTDSVGLTASDEVRVVPVNAPPNQAPMAAFNAMPPDGDVPLLVQFDGSLSSDPDTDLIESVWDFGDGSSSAQEITTHIYSLPGLYTVTLTVTDVLGANSSLSQSILVRLPGLIALYDFSEGTGTTVFDISGVGPALDLTIEDPANTTWPPGGGLSLDAPTLLRSSGPATKIRDAAIAAEELSIEVWVEAANLTQAGPARIVAMSMDPINAGSNFALSQEGDRWEGRVRTTVTDDFGLPSLALPPGSATTALSHLVYTRDSAGATSFYIDGVRQGIATARGLFSNWSSLYELVVGNEPTANRPWLGTLHKAAIYARALDEVDVQQSFSSGPGLAVSVPRIVGEPNDQLVVAGNSASLQVLAIGPAPILYQWQRYDGFNWVDEPGASGASYVTPALGLADDGALYRAEVSNLIGTTLSQSVSVQVVASFQASLSLDAGPATRSVTAGTDLLIPLTVTNTGTVDLDPIGLDAPDCDLVSSLVGDTNLDGRQQIGEIWSYDCTLSNVGFQQTVTLDYQAQALDGTPAGDAKVVVVEILGASSRASAGLVVLYEFAAGAGTTAFDVSGSGTPFDLNVATPANVSWPAGGGLSIDLPTVLTQTGPATKIIDALQQTNAITLEAWVRPAQTQQSGPARIVSLSQDPFPNGGNFMLGQTTDRFDARLRTTTTNGFGTPGRASTAGSATAARLSHLAYTRDAAGAETFYVDGIQVDSGTRLGTFGNWGTGYGFAVGNEPTVDRPWLGTLHLLAIYDTALSSGTIASNYQAGLSAPSLCGNFVVESGEACDQGGVHTLTCDADCSAPACGDGSFNPLFEQCEMDTDCLGGDVCDGACMCIPAPICGNSILELGEQCDDGGASASCDADCTFATCGDGTFNPSAEECEVDADCSGANICDGACLCVPAPVCGNGIIEFGEECDDGGESATCDVDCSFAVCGDALLNPSAGETCESSMDCAVGEACTACACGPGNREFFDDFDRATLGPNWTLAGGQFSILTNRLAENFAAAQFTSRMRWIDDTTSGDQYSKLELVDPGTDTFGFLFRFGDLGGHYEVHLPPGTPQWRWEQYDPAFNFVERVDDCLGDVAFGNGNFIGALVQGVGIGTSVSVWRWDSDPNPAAGYDATAWGAADCVMTADPTTPLDVGRGIGVRAHAGASTVPGIADNWSAGDLPPPAVCGDGFLDPGEQCEVSGDCGIQAVFDFRLEVVDPAYPGGVTPGVSGAGDIDGDGLIDVVSSGGSVLQWYKAPSHQRFPIDDGVGVGPGGNGIVVFDVDGDLDLDVVTGLLNAGLAWWENPGTGLPAQSTWTRHVIDAVVTGFLHDLKLGDIDGDMQDEIVALYSLGGALYWYDIPSDPIADSWPRTQILGGINDPFVGLALGDIDADGDLDVVASNRWYERPVDPTTPNWTARPVFASAVQNIFIEDVDADGNIDVVGSEGFSTTGRLIWAKAPADPLTGSWTEIVVASNLDGPENAWAGDLDADGDIDLMTGEMGTSDGYFDNGSNLLVYENRTGDGMSWNEVVVASGVGVSARITPIDIDADGDIDFTADGNAEDHIFLWVNQVSPLSVPQICSSACTCIVAPPECSNGIDDDGDSFIDFPADPDCSDPNDPIEAPEPAMLLQLLGGGLWLAALRHRHARRRKEARGSEREERRDGALA